MPQHVLSSASLQLALDARGRAVSLRLLPNGYELLGAATHPVGLWQLGLIRPVRYADPIPPLRVPDLPYAGHEWWANRHEYLADLALDSDTAPAPRIEAAADRLTLTTVVPVPGGNVTLVVEIAGGDALDLAFTFRVELPDGWALKRVTCPRLRGFGDLAMPDADALLYPENWGVLRHNPLADMTQYTGQYPGAVNWAQMAAWLHGDAGLYIGVRDPDTNHTGIDVQYVEGGAPAPWNTERWHLPDPHRPAPPVYGDLPLAERITAGRAPAIQCRVNHWPEMVAHWACPYPVVLRGFAGGWYEAARIHREWALRQRWCRRGPLARRTDASPALAGLDLWFCRYAFHPGALEPTPAWDFQKAMHRLLDYFGMPFGVHWYHWHNFSWHRNFPGHSPVQEGFEPVLRDLQARGVVVMPYCQGRMLYRDRKTFEQERTHASLEANGQPYLEMYTPQDDWPLALCPGSAWPREQWQAAARMLWERYGVEGVYFDQVTAMPPSLCYHGGHGHPLGGGTFYWRGYDTFLGGLAPLIAKDPTRFLSSELMADAFLDRIDLYLAFVPPLEDYVPLHPAIYGGYAAVMGRATPESLYEDLQLFVACQGEQLLFGGQLGWMNERILDFPAAAAILRDLARLRRHLRRFLHFGTLDAPLAVETDGPPVTLTLAPTLTGKPRPLPVTRPAVRHTAWTSPEGRRLILLLNEATTPRQVRIPLPAAYPTASWTARRQGQAEQTEPLAVRAGCLELTVAPLAAAALVADA